MMTSLSVDMRKIKKIANAAWTIVFILSLANVKLTWPVIALITANSYIRDFLGRNS